MAPDMPTAMYSSGATTLPVWPTCQSFGAYPASTAARDAPTAAPILSATGSMYLVKFSRDCIARPPEMMILAEVSSGRSDLDSSSPTNDEMPGSAAAVAFSTDAEPPSPVAWNVEVRTVMTFLASFDFTVWIALPA